VPGRVEVCVSDKSISKTARITREIYQKGSYNIYNLGDISIYFKAGSDVSIGDQIRVVGSLEKRLIRPGYIDKRLISSDIQIITRGRDENLFSVYRWLYILSKWSIYMRSVVDKHLIPTHSKLVAGILFGSRENIPIILHKNLINTGTIHIIAASGYNITIVAGFVIAILSKFLKRKQAIFFAIISIGMFVAVSGGGEAVTRAAIMGIIAFLAQAIGKLYTALYSLGMTVVIMLLLKPTLVSSVSFQLSVASTLGILLIGNRLNMLGAKIFQGDSSLILKSNTLRMMLLTAYYDFSTTLSATIATLPIILIYFDRFSLVTLVVNMLVLWTIPPIMLFGFLLVSFGLFSSFLANMCSYILWPFLTYFTRVVSWFGSLHFASYEWEWFNEYMLTGYYIILATMLSFKTRKRPLNE
jgi:competence protein ComEC